MAKPYSPLKHFFKRNTHNTIFKMLAGFGRSLNRIYENRNHQSPSNGELLVIQKLKSINPKVIIDGGANIGDYALMIIQEHPQSIIFCFEPVKNTYDILENNILPYNNIKALNFGLYKENTEKEINHFDLNTLSSIYDIQGMSIKSNKKTTINLIRGDQFLEENNIDKVDFLKLDVEGAEYDALLGFEKSLDQQKIKVIQFEYGYINVTTRKLLIDFYELLENKGYVLGKIYPKKVEFRKYEFRHEDFIGPNILAVLKSETELIANLSKA